MRLVDLEPRWIIRDGQQIAILFKCPHCPTSKTWLSCKFVAPMKVSEQYELFRDKAPDADPSEIVPARKDFAWGKTGSTFVDLSVTPSIDASASGHWHGFVTNGEVR